MFEELQSNFPEKSENDKEKILADTISGHMSELLGMYDKEKVELFNTKVLERYGIAPELLDRLDDVVARKFMEDFVFPLLNADEIKNPRLQDQLAEKAADELNRLIESQNSTMAAA